ncbi:MAG: response regulator [Pseudomonadota bacterium]
MRVLIVESDPNLGQIWCNHIQRLGADVSMLRSQGDAVEALQDDLFDVLILDLELTLGSAMAVADYASYRRPDCKVIFVTSNSFFSDGTIFNYMANAAALIPLATKPEDMAALVEHHGR